MPAPGSGAELDKIFVAEEALLLDAYKLGVEVYNSGFQPSFIVGLWRGGSTVGIAVQECLTYLGVETDHISIRTSYRGASDYARMLEDQSPSIRVHGTQYLLENLNASDRLLIVDDVYSTGRNVAAVIDRLCQRLKKNMPGDVRIAVPWYKPAQNRTGREPDFYLHETEQWLVLPYELNGLSLEEIRTHKSFMNEIFDETGQTRPLS
ncbi:MAG: hypoxanthine phosphoribosyltransferase [Thiotrichales bacterium]|nr:hypoxanthine phosphoribosyltransferase [Thiotrichales bacterium]|tara:strand:+ start:367 stop:987 length:621 start_codon:yes stop_codon:yes gene_type:complete